GGPGGSGGARRTRRRLVANRRGSATSRYEVVRPEVVVGTLRLLVDRLTADVGAEAARAQAGRALFAMAVPGGSVGVHGFPAFAGIPFDWGRTHVFWADE